MDSHNEEVTFRAAAWSDQVAADLELIADASPRDLDAFRQLVERGAFNLLEMHYQGDRLGVVIWSIDTELDGRVIVINAAAAKPAEGVCVTSEMFNRFRSLAEVVGARALRCWTSRPGLVRKVEALGAKRKYVMEIEL